MANHDNQHQTEDDKVFHTEYCIQNTFLKSMDYIQQNKRIKLFIFRLILLKNNCAKNRSETIMRR
ncbi:MAG: hypothetical protein US11_C0002G0052 [Candidatus Roizmanbacteria bacterium GW2011_GWA2_36_23]|uniref:Uncharacterized protein n=1 Tax=Candidatus Roizmanbacteria bacterium GW2011_GWA2_36_23 TaxID=1618480 RepID=A0A0G0E508_9BACT|nr:MAG: hypothetical protein US11_C0002G0052 [Candidatus Roizmanbacteria bacterium GW2011_GWA2_36_23]